MKTHRTLIPILTGFLITGTQAQTTISLDNVRVFLNRNLMVSTVLGTSSEGNLIVQPSAPLFLDENTGLASYGTPLRIDGLELNGDGSFDDYIDFTLQFDAARDSGAQVSLTGAGVGVNGGLNPGANEQLTVSVVVTGVSVPGWASIDGFTEVEMYLGGNGIMTTGEADVNGITYTDGFDATAGFTFNIGPVTLTGQPDTVVINNIVASAGDFRLRTADFSITYDPNGVQPPPAPKLMVANDLNLRPTAEFVFPNQNGGPNQGGTNGGEINAQPGFDATMVVPAPSIDLPLRWSALDLDGIGASDDYIDFTIRATAAGGVENVTFAGEGIGITGGGTGGLDAGEELTFEVVDISLSPGTTPGTLAFDGFFGAGFFISGNGGTDLPTTGDGQGNINGNTVMISLNGTGYTPVTQAVTFPLAPTVVFDMPSYTAGTVNPIGRARNFDIQFSYQEGSAPATGLAVQSITYSAPDVTITSTGVSDGQTYHAEFSPDLSTAFTPVSDSDAVASGGQVIHTVDANGATKGFYRIVEGAAP